MRFYEHEAKKIFGSVDIPIPKQYGIIRSPEELVTVALEFPVMLKSMVLIGGRGKAGGIKKAENIDLYKQRGVFTGPKTLKVGDKEITADKIVLAAGTRPSIPPIEGLDNVPYMTSREILRVKELPKELLIV